MEQVREKWRSCYPQDEPPGSETFPAIGQSSDLLLTERHKEEEEEEETIFIRHLHKQSKSFDIFRSFNAPRTPYKSICLCFSWSYYLYTPQPGWLRHLDRNKRYFLLLFVGQNQTRVQDIVLWFPSAVPANTKHIQVLPSRRYCGIKHVYMLKWWCHDGDSRLTHLGDHPCHFSRYSTLP